MRDVVFEHRTNLDMIQADMDAFATKYPEAYNALLRAQAAYGDGSEALQDYMEKSTEEGWAYFYKEYEQKKSAMENEQKLYDDALVQLNGRYITIDG